MTAREIPLHLQIFPENPNLDVSSINSTVLATLPARGGGYPEFDCQREMQLFDYIWNISVSSVSTIQNIVMPAFFQEEHNLSVLHIDIPSPRAS